MTRSKFPLVTASYAVVLLGTTITLAVVPSPTHDHLLAGSSTDVIHLRRDPLLVLLASLFWLPNDMSIALAPLVVLVLFVAERRFGAVRLIAAFVAGHVAATLLTEGWVWWAVDAGLLGHGHEHRIDVGPSYGTCALIGLLVAALSSRQRMLGYVAAGVLFGLPIIFDSELTTIGHLLAVVIGLVMWRIPFFQRGGPVRGTHPAPDTHSAPAVVHRFP